MPDKKDMFKEKHPSTAFLKPQGEQAEADAPDTPTPIARILEKKTKPERKTRNVHILMKPSKYGRLKGIADAYGLNFNEMLDTIFDEFLKGADANNT